MSEYVQSRLKARIIEIINTLIANGDIKNSKLSRFASVTDLVLSKDNAYATVYVNCIDEKALERSVSALQSAAGYIQARLASVLKIKNTPKLTFKVDDTLRNAMRIDALIDSLHASHKTDE